MSTLIEPTDRFVGPFYDANSPGMVRMGHKQSMVYGSNYLGPFNLLADEKE